MDDDGTTGNGEPLNQRPGVVFPVAVVVVCCIILSLWLKVPGLILSVFILLCTFLLVNPVSYTHLTLPTIYSV